MSILIKTPPAAQVSEATRRANQVRNIANRSTKQMLKDVGLGLDAIWKAPDPAAVLVELGTDAQAAFELSSATVTFLATTLSGGDYQDELNVVLAKVGAIPAFTVNGDGTVTID